MALPKNALWLVPSSSKTTQVLALAAILIYGNKFLFDSVSRVAGMEDEIIRTFPPNVTDVLAKREVDFFNCTNCKVGGEFNTAVAMNYAYMLCVIVLSVLVLLGSLNKKHRLMLPFMVFKGVELAAWFKEKAILLPEMATICFGIPALIPLQIYLLLSDVLFFLVFFVSACLHFFELKEQMANENNEANLERGLERNGENQRQRVA